jgi:formamidopyrimidine-DNA glycosylase
VPELLEVETYRRAAERVVGRTVRGVRSPDPWFLKRGTTPEALEAALVGARVRAAARRGKLLMLPMSSGAVLGLRFGMTGRLVVDGELPIDRLEHSSGRVDPAWERFGLDLSGGGALAIVDARRLGGVELDPDLDRLGPEASTVTVAQLRHALGTSTAPLKAVLLDQQRLAGLGNLLVDETLWRVGLDPARPAGSLTPDEQRRLADGIRRTVRTLGRRGGSHTGDLHEARTRGASCPRCGTPLLRRTVGGRTTYSCPAEQHTDLPGGGRAG